MKSTQLILLVVVVLATFSSAIKFELETNKEKCLKQSYRTDTLIKGSVSVIPPVSGMALHVKAMFAFTSQGDEEYTFCFTDKTPSGVQAQRAVTLIVQEGEKEKDYSELASKQNLKPLEVELMRMADQAEILRNEFSYMKAREATHRDTTESTNSRVAFLSVSSLIVLAGLGIFQIYYLKKYFKSKKLI